MPTPHGIVVRYRKGAAEWQETILKDELTIGRSPDCALLIESPGVSRQHAKISLRADGIWLTDLNSSNGTFVNEVRLTPQSAYRLSMGSSFRISDYIFEIKQEITEPGLVIEENENILLYRTGVDPWQQFRFKSVVTIGRSTDCDLSVEDSKVSRHHVRLERRLDGFWITDLGSSNGTRIDNQKINPHQPLKIVPGNMFSIGNMFFMIKDQEIITEAPESIFRLWYKSSGGIWKDYHITKNIVIGRSTECDLVVDDTKASRRHVQLEIRSNNLWLTDLGSRNGTKVAGRTIPPNVPMMILPGQSFQIGGVTFTITLPGMPQPEKTPMPFTAAQDQPLMRPEKFPEYPQAMAGIPPMAPMPAPIVKKSSPWGWVVALMGIAIVLACICVAGISAVFILMQEPKDNRAVSASQTALIKTQVAVVAPNESQPSISTSEETIPPRLTDTPIPEAVVITPTPTEAITPPLKQDTWLIMLYNDADDQILERDLLFDANEAEYAGSSDQVQIVIQLDRYKGAYTGDGNWSVARRFYITQDGNLQAIQSPLLADLDEINMGNPNTLAEFMIWAINTYPASKYVLIMSDHGSGWPGGYSDQDSGDDGIFLFELSQVLDYVVRQTGISQLELLGFDACLMSQLEVLTMIQPYARYAVVSEEIEPSVGWAYSAFLSQLINNPSSGGDELARMIVSTYIDQDQRFWDDESRKEFLAERDITTDYSPAEISEALWQESTLAGIDLKYITDVNEALNDFAFTIQSLDQSMVAKARTYAQAYTSAFGEDVPPSYLDLLNFAKLVATESGDSQVQSAFENLSQAIHQAVIIERHGNGRPGSTGMTIYFPNSQLYEATYDDTYGFQYTAHVNLFAETSLWDEFLFFHYTGNGFSK